MPDVHNEITRSFNMSRVKSKDTKPEMLVRSFLHGKGFRYKLHDKNLPGKPDLVLPKYKTIVFIHGCFWHGHEGCKYFSVPQTRTDWWLNKIDTNIRNDQKSIKSLNEAGWKIVTIWGCELKPAKIEKTFRHLLRVFT
jgi:DNA mismatch endonuclease (patch repair protein)